MNTLIPMAPNSQTALSQQSKCILEVSGNETPPINGTISSNSSPTIVAPHAIESLKQKGKEATLPASEDTKSFGEVFSKDSEQNSHELEITTPASEMEGVKTFNADHPLPKVHQPISAQHVPYSVPTTTQVRETKGSDNKPDTAVGNYQHVMNANSSDAIGKTILPQTALTDSSRNPEETSASVDSPIKKEKMEPSEIQIDDASTDLAITGPRDDQPTREPEEIQPRNNSFLVANAFASQTTTTEEHQATDVASNTYRAKEVTFSQFQQDVSNETTHDFVSPKALIIADPKQEVETIAHEQPTKQQLPSRGDEFSVPKSEKLLRSAIYEAGTYTRPQHLLAPTPINVEHPELNQQPTISTSAVQQTNSIQPFLQNSTTLTSHSGDKFAKPLNEQQPAAQIPALPSTTGPKDIPVQPSIIHNSAVVVEETQESSTAVEKSGLAEKAPSSMTWAQEARPQISINYSSDANADTLQAELHPPIDLSVEDLSFSTDPINIETSRVGQTSLSSPPLTSSPQLQPELARSVAQQLAVASMTEPNRPLELALSPEELGRVRLTFSPSENGMVVSVIAERPETLDLMRRNINSLAQEFLGIGYDQISFNFNQFGSGQHENGQQSPEQTAQSPTEYQSEKTQRMRPLAINLVQSERVDIRV